MSEFEIRIPARKKQPVTDKNNPVVKVSADAYNALVEIYNESTLSMKDIASLLIIEGSWVRNKKDKQGDKMKLYDIVAADGEFVESLTQREIMNKFGLTKCRFRTFLDNSYLIDGKYWIDDSAEDMRVTRNGCRKMLKQFDALTENIRRFVGWEA